MTISYKAIGRNIRQARNQAGITQEKLAEQIHLSPQHFGRLERGERRISLDQLGMVSDALDVPLDSLLFGSVHALPASIQDGPGTIINFLSAGCSKDAKNLMLDVCALIAKRDKYAGV